MTKFEQVGINYQHNANSIEQAKRSFEYSCNCCCTKGMHIECDRCCIATVHSMVVAILADKEVKANEKAC